MSQHNYTNPAFCQNSEFYPVPSTAKSSAQAVESIYNRSLNLNFNTGTNACRNPRDGPLRIQRSMSTRSFVSQTAATTRKTTPAATVPVHMSRQQLQQQHHQQQQQHLPQQQQHYQPNVNASTEARTTQSMRIAAEQRPANLTYTTETFEMRSGSGRYALVPVEELSSAGNSRYAIVPGPSSLSNAKRYAKSQDNLDRYNSQMRLRSDEEPHSFHEDSAEQYTSLPPVFDTAPCPRRQESHRQTTTMPKIKHAFSSDFGSKSFLIVDKNSNQRYQMVPTAEDEEIVDDNQEIIQMHNGRAHRYAVIPTEDIQDAGSEEEEETCLSINDLNQSENYAMGCYETTPTRTPLPRTSTPQKGLSMVNLNSYPSTPLKNPLATKMLHELLSTPRKTAVPLNVTPKSMGSGINRLESRQLHKSQQQIYFTPRLRKLELSPQRLHYETVKPVVPPKMATSDRTMAVITPRVAGSTKVHPTGEDEDSSIQGKMDTAYPQKVANATMTLGVVSLMLVLGSAMNSALIIYMIAHFGKSFYLQFSLVAAFCGVGLGFLGFRSRHCEWLPNRSYTSGYILVTMFCLLKCFGLLVILVFDPYPGLPLHDVTTGVILGLSTFTMFFIGLGVIGSLWCYRPPPDNRVNVV